jgi:hypothetical protein
MDEQYIQALYGQLKDNYDFGSLDEFKTQLNDAQFRKSLFDDAGSKLDLGNFSDFESMIKKKSPDTASSGGSLPSLDGKQSSTTPEQKSEQSIFTDPLNSKPAAFNPFELPEEKPVKPPVPGIDLDDHPLVNDKSWQQMKARHDELNSVIGKFAETPGVDPADIQKLHDVAKKTAPPEPVKPLSLFNGVQSWAGVAGDALKTGGSWLYDNLITPINEGLNELVYKPLAGANDVIDRAIDNSYTSVTGKPTPSWLRKGTYLDNLTKEVQDEFNRTAEKHDNIPSNIVRGTAQSLPLVASLFTGEGEAVLADKAVTGMSNLTKVLAGTGALSSFKDATDQGLDMQHTAEATFEGGVKGGIQGLTLEAQMLVGGALGRGVTNKLAEYGLLKGELTPALMHALSIGTVFSGTSAAEDLAQGKDVNWDGALTQFGMGFGFELPGIIKAGGRDLANHIETNAVNDRAKAAAYGALAVKDMNDAAVIRNLAGFTPEQIAKINQSDHSSDDLYAASIRKGIDAYNADNMAEKKDAYLQQLSLKNQADIKLATERIVNNKQAFLDGFAQSDLKPEVKLDLLSKVDQINKLNNPVELQKTDIGKNINDITNSITMTQEAISKAADEGERSKGYLSLNDLIGKRIEAQNQLFDLNIAQEKAETEKQTRVKQIDDLQVQANAAHAGIVEGGEDLPAEERWQIKSDRADIPDFKAASRDELERKLDDHYDQQIESIRASDRPVAAPEAFAPKAEESTQATESAPEENQPVDDGSNLTEADIRLTGEKFVPGENKFTHLTNHFDVVKQILGKGQFIGKGEDLANFTKEVSTERFHITKDNGGSPYFQKGKFYGEPTQKYLVVAEGAEKFTPNINRANSKSFEQSEGIGVLNPEYRGKEHLGIYQRGADGEYYKIQKVEPDNSSNPAPAAKEPSIDGEIFYHGSPVSGLTEFSADYAGGNTNVDSARKGVWVSNSPNVAKMFRDWKNPAEPGKTGEVYKVKIDVKDPLYTEDTNEGGRIAAIKKAEELGKDSVVFSDEEGNKQVFAFDPKSVKIDKGENDTPVADISSADRTADENGVKSVKVSNNIIGDADIVGVKDDGSVTLRMADGSTEDLAPDDLDTAGISAGDVDLFKRENNLAAEGEKPVPGERSLSERISDLATKIKSGDQEFTEEEAQLHALYPDEVAAAAGAPAGDGVQAAQSIEDGRDLSINKAELQAVKETLSNVLPNIDVKYYDNVRDFNNELARQTGVRSWEIGAASITHGFVGNDKVIHLNPDHLRRDTPIHEQGHILTAWAYHYSRPLYDRMMDAGKSMGNLHAELHQNGYRLSGDPLFDEAFVTAIGHEGAGRINQLGKNQYERSKIKQLIHEAWTKFERWVVAKTGFALSKGRSIDNMGVQEFMDYVNDKYLLSDVKLSDISSAELAKLDGQRYGKRASQSADPNRPVRNPGEPLKDYIKRVRDYNDQQDPNKQSPPVSPSPPLPIVQAPAPTWDLEPETRKEYLGRKWQDYLNRAKKVQDAIEKAGGKINEKTDFYTAADLQGSKAAQLQRELYERMVKSPDKKNPAFFERMTKDGISKEDLDSYLRASHVEEYNREVGTRRRQAYESELQRLQDRKADANKRSNAKSEDYYDRAIKELQAQKNAKYPLMDDGAAGMTNAEAKKILDNFKQTGVLDNLKKYGDEFVKEVSNVQLDVQKATGVIDQDTYDSLKKKYKNYVPFHVEDFLVEKPESGRGVKRNSGSSVNRVDNLIRKAKGSVTRTADERVSPSTYGIVQLEKAYIEGEKNKTLNVLYDMVEQNPNDSVFEIVHPKYAPTYRRDGTVSGFKEITDPKIQNSAVQLYRDGRKVYLDIKDPTLRRAIKKEGIVKTIGVLDHVNNYLRQVNTLKSPVFWVTNAVKDFQTAGFNLTTEDQKGLGAKMAKGVLPAMKAVFAYEHGKRTGPWADTYERYLQAGGKTTVIRPNTDIEKIKSIEKVVEDIGKKKNMIQNTKALVHWISTFGEATELGTRVSVFKAGLDVGMTDQQAAVLSRNSTINFNKKGELSGIAGNFYLMFNGGMQGKLYLAKKLTNSPLARKIYGGMLVAGVMTAALNQQASDKDDPANNYDSLSEYEKQNNFIFKNYAGDGFIKIPAGHGLNLPFYLGGQIYDVLMGHSSPGKAALNTGVVAFNSFSPIANADWFQTIVPSEPLRFSAQLATNKNAFGSPVFKDQKFGARQPNSHTHFEHTDPALVKLASGLNSLTGGTGVKSGLIDISPDVMEWMISTAGGGLGRTVEQTPEAVVDVSAHAAQKLGFMPESVRLTPFDASQVPLLSKFYTEGKPTNYKAIIFTTLQKSGNTEIDNPETTDFYNAVAEAVGHGQISKQQYKQYMREFQNNQMRLLMGDQLPDFEKKDFDMMKKKR